MIIEVVLEGNEKELSTIFETVLRIIKDLDLELYDLRVRPYSKRI